MRKWLNRYRTTLWVALLGWGLVLGPAYTAYLYFDPLQNSDARDYLQVAQGNYNVTITHRYRPVVPVLASVVALPIQAVYTRLWPHRAESLWPLRLGFLVVNSLLFAVLAVLLWRLALHAGAAPWAALVGLVAVFTSRWAGLLAGIPYVDSLYLLVLALAAYGVVGQRYWAVAAALVLGPLAKESWLMLLPFVLWFAPGVSIPQRLQWLAWAGLGLVLALIFRAWVSTRLTDFDAGVQNALNHSENIWLTVRRLFTPRGIGELLTVIGPFTLIPLLNLSARQRGWLRNMPTALAWWLVPLMAHVFLSGEAARMLFAFTPLWVLSVALPLTQAPRWRWAHKWLTNK
jgi:hypothetical protein